MTVFNDEINARFNILINGAPGLEKVVNKSIGQMQMLESQARKTSASIKEAFKKSANSIQGDFGRIFSPDVANKSLAETKGMPGSQSALNKDFESVFPTKKAISAQQILNSVTDETIMKFEALGRIQEINAKISELHASQMRDMGAMFGLLFGGMQLQRFGLSMVRFLLPAMDKLEGYTSSGTKKVNAMKASFEFLKFSMFEALTSTKLFQRFVELLIEGANWLSKFVAKHPNAVAIAGVLGGIATVLGSIMIPAGFFFQMRMLTKSMKTLALNAELAKLSTDKIKGKTVAFNFIATGLNSIVAKYNLLKNKVVHIASTGVSKMGTMGSGVMQGAGFGIGGAISGAISKIGFGAIGKSAANMFVKGFKSINPIQLVLTITGGAFSYFREQLNSLLDNLGIVGDYGRIVGNVLGIAFNFASGAVDILIGFVIDLFTKPLELLKSFIGWLSDWGEVFSYWGSVIKEKVTDALLYVFNLLPGWVQNVITYVGDIFSSVVTFFSNVKQWIVDKIQPVIDWALGAFKGVASFISGIWDKVTGAVDAAADATERMNKDTKEFSYFGKNAKTSNDQVAFSLDLVTPKYESMSIATDYAYQSSVDLTGQSFLLMSANEDLMSSSDSLITKFGTEKEKVDSLTSSYNKLAEAKKKASSGGSSGGSQVFYGKDAIAQSKAAFDRATQGSVTGG